MSVKLSVLPIKGSPDIAESPLPKFRSREYDYGFGDDGSLLPEHKINAGKNLAFRVLPYKTQDSYGRDRKLFALRTVELENNVMKAIFLPDFGGRLYSLYDKSKKRELLFCNPVIQPANIALRDAWLSGGIEWNIGRTGHTYHTCASVFFDKCTDKTGMEYLRMYEYDRCEGLCFSIEFRLPPDSSVLYAHIDIYNTQPYTVPMYWWTNIAVKETSDMRVLSATDEVIFMNPGKGFGYGKMPYLASIPEKDASFPSVYYYANEYFFQTPDNVKYPWEEAVYPSENWAFAEFSTDMLKYRKMFTWGTHQGGQIWRDYLSDKGTGDYIEIQGGIARTQLHGLDMPDSVVWSFDQAFTSVDADAERLCGLEYNAASRKLESLFRREFPVFADENETKRTSLTLGSGWGAVEQKKRLICGESSLPFDFPDESIGKDELPWLCLLENDVLPEDTYSFMTGDFWTKKLIKADSKEAFAHLGIIYYENGDDANAEIYFNKSLPHPLSYRNLSLIKLKGNNINSAVELMEKSVKLNSSYSFITEYSDLLIRVEEYEKCFVLLEKLAADAPSRLWINRAKAALKTQRYKELEEMFSREYSCIREGETALTDLWFEWAKNTGQPNQTNPPAHIDFRMS